MTRGTFTGPNPQASVRTGFFVPVLTIVLLMAFIAVFVLEQRLTSWPSGAPVAPDIRTYVALGGLSRKLVAAGEGFRVFSAPFLHANLAHLINNALVFALAGYRLERLAGWAWTFCIFTVGALAGSVMSLALSAPSTVSVGASGAIMAMMGALFLLNFRLPPSKGKTRIQRRLFFMMALALLPVSHGTGAVAVDYGAHLGGALLGLLLGFLLLNTWHEGSPLPSFRNIAAVLAGAGLLSMGSTAYAVRQRYPYYEALLHTIPAAQYPHEDAEIREKAAGLLAAYPGDPRAHLLSGIARLRRGDAAGAEQELRIALPLSSGPSSLIWPALGNTVRILLAEVVLERGSRAEAATIAHDACGARGEAAPPPALTAFLVKSLLCTPPKAAVSPA